MKKLSFIIILLFFASNLSLGRSGLAENYFETPGGHIICRCDPYEDSETPILIGNDKLKQLEKWYFYRNSIIGIGKNYYFIFDEKNEKLQHFIDKEEWESNIRKQNLQPLIKRWMDLSDSPDNFLFFIVITSIFTVPIILISILTMATLTYKKKIRWNRKILIITGGVIVMVGLLTFLQLNVESI